MIATTLAASCLLQITGFYNVVRIKSHDPMMVTTVIAFPTVVLITTKICLDFAMVYTDASCEYPNSFNQWVKQALYNAAAESQHLNLNLYKDLHRTFRTYRPFQFEIGPFFHATHTTYINLEFGVVFQSMATLLLTFRS